MTISTATPRSKNGYSSRESKFAHEPPADGVVENFTRNLAGLAATLRMYPFRLIMFVPHNSPAVGSPESTPPTFVNKIDPSIIATVLQPDFFRKTCRDALIHSQDEMLDEFLLVERVRTGDQDAACALVTALRPIILKCIQKRMPRWASEEDVVQTCLVKVVSHLDQFSGTVPLRHWVSRIAVNTALKYIRHESIRPELRMSDLSEEQRVAIEEIPGTDNEALIQNQAREIIDLLLAQLKPDERLLITLLHLEQRTVFEISLMTGLSISMVKVKAFRTRKKMRGMGSQLFTQGNSVEVARVA